MAEEKKKTSATADEKKEAAAKKEEAPSEKETEVKEEKPVEKKEEKKEENKKEEKKEVPKKFEEIVKGIENLSVLELSELVKILEERLGVSAAAPVAMPAAGPAPAGEQEEQAGEKSEYTIHLKDAGDKKIEVIKAVRTATGKGLKEAKDLVDAVSGGPQVVKEGVPADEAKELEKALKEAGATVELK